MRLQSVLLAENVDLLRDGRLVVFGGDFDTFEVSETPVSITFMLVVKVVTEDGDSLEGHVFNLEITNPAGEHKPIGETRNIPFLPRQDAPDLLRPGSNLIVKIAIAFQNPGVYFLHVLVDGNELTKLPIHVRRIETVASEADNEHNDN